MKGITPIIKWGSGCDYHRLVLPLTHMGMDLRALFDGKVFGDLLTETKILLFNRTPNMDIDAFKEQREKYGFKIVVDLDDYWELYPNHILAPHWYANKINLQIIKCLTEADAVMVTTDALADKVRPINKNVHVVPNAIPYDQGQFNSEKNISFTHTRFLYAGGSTHFRDIQELKNGFKKILNDHNFKRSQFILAGVDKSNNASSTVWNKMSQSFSLNGKMPNYTEQGTLPLDSYMDHYKNCDITLIPLETNIFNKYKSNLKILESAAKYNPCIASDASPYADFPNRDLIMYGRNAATWFSYLRKCATDPVFVKESGLALGEYCREHYNLIKVNELRKQIFEHLISQI